MKQRFGFLASLDFTNMPVEQVTHILAESGYQAVSWPLARFDPQTTSASDRKELLRTTQNAGLEISEWVIQLDYIDLNTEVRQERIDQTCAILECIADLDTQAPANLFTGPAPWNPTAPRLGKDLTEGQAWEMVYQAFDVLVPLAEKLNIRLAVEGVFGHLAHDYYTVQELLHHYSSSNLGVNFDPSHGTLYGNDTPWCIRQLGNRIFHVHLKDAVGCPGGLPGETFLFPLLGEGGVPWGEMFAELDRIQYEGFLTVEFESFAYYKNILKNDPAAAAHLAMNQIKQLLGLHENA